MTAPTRARKLAEEAAEAAELRAYQTHPDVVALRIERVRLQVERMCWGGIILGLAFTMTNVQKFASAGTRPWSLPWLAAWLLDPTVSQYTEAVAAAYTEAATAVHERGQVRPDGRPTRRRKLLGEYVAEARAAWSPGVVITPAWVREVTACSRGLSSKVANTLVAELGQGGGVHERS